MSLALLSLAGKRALVTGAGTGLGRQMVLGLAEAGAELVTGQSLVVDGGWTVW